MNCPKNHPGAYPGGPIPCFEPVGQCLFDIKYQCPLWKPHEPAELVLKGEYDRVVAEVASQKDYIKLLEEERDICHSNNRATAEQHEKEMAIISRACREEVEVLKANNAALAARNEKLELDAINLAGRVAALQDALIEERALTIFAGNQPFHPGMKKLREMYNRLPDFIQEDWRKKARKELVSLLANPPKVIVPTDHEKQLLGGLIEFLGNCAEDETAFYGLEMLKRWGREILK